MNQETADQIVSLLESIDSKLDMLTELEARLGEIESSVSVMKMDVSGFTHEGKSYPGNIEEIANSLSAIESTLASIDTNTSG